MMRKVCCDAPPCLNLSSTRFPRFSTYPLVAITKYGQGRLAGFMHERHISDAQMYTPLVRLRAELRTQGGRGAVHA